MSELMTRPFDFVHLSQSVKALLALMSLCSVRLYALGIVFPPLGDEAMKGSVRNGFVLLIGFYIAWGQPLDIVENINTMRLLMLVLKEAVLGLMLGFACSVVFWVAEAVGALIDNQAGFNNVQQTNPMSGQESTPLGNVMGQLSHACFWMLGGATTLIALLFESFLWWPLNRMAPGWSDILIAFTQTQLAEAMRMTITLAAPTMLVLLLIDLGFGLIAKTADKLEPNSLAQPIKGAVAMLMVALLIALFFHEARPQFALRSLQGDISAGLERAGKAR